MSWHIQAAPAPPTMFGRDLFCFSVFEKQHPKQLHLHDGDLNCTSSKLISNPHKIYGALHLLMQRNLYTCWLTFFGYGNDYLPQMFTGPKSKTTRSQALSLRREWNINWQLLRLLIKEAEMINSIGEARYLDVYFSTRLGSNGHALFFGGWSLLLWWKHGS